jgi:hypothetical protein
VVKARDLVGVASAGDELSKSAKAATSTSNPICRTGGEFGELLPTAADFEKPQFQ